MKFLNRIFLIICAPLAIYSCVESTALEPEEIEKVALRSWMEINRPDLLDNYQENGGYYVEILDEGVADSAAVRYDDSWVWFDVTCRDLSGNVAMTRNSDLAQMQNVYTDHTHYVPYFLYCGEERANSLPEGIYLTMRNKLKVGDKEVSVRYGTKMRIYMPSSLVSDDEETGMKGDGGYQGQYSLDAGRPMIAEVRVWGHIGNPVAYEDQWVKAFAKANGGIAPEPANKNEATAASAQRRNFKRDTRAEANKTIYNDLWYPAVDSIAGLYINYMYNPKTKPLNFDCLRGDTLLYAGQTAYTKGKIFGHKSLAQINKEIDEALIKRFGEGIDPADADSLRSVQTAKVWYVTRLLDGFVIDTNITEVQQIVYGNDYDPAFDVSSALSFVTAKDSDDNNYVDAWKYAIPQMKLGAWNVILTTSSSAYGAVGVAGSNSSSSSQNNYMDYYNYYNYYNSYYGNGYYNNYYNGYYGGMGGMGMGGMGMGGMYGGMGGMYGGGMYGGYDYYNNYYNSMYYNSMYNNSYTTDESEEADITTTSEVLPYTPMLWQIYIEEK